MKSIKSELRKIMAPQLVMMSIIGLLLLMFMTDAKLDIYNKKVYMIFELLYGRGKELIGENAECANIILWSGYTKSMWFKIFTPLLVSLPLMISNASENSNGHIRYVISRQSNLRYCISKLVAGMFSSGIIMCVSYTIFGILVMILFPNISTYNISPEEMMYIFPYQKLPYIASKLVGSFLYGMYVGIFGMFITAVFKDKYLVICMPVMISFGINRLITFQYSKAMSVIDFTDAESVRKANLYETLYPEYIAEFWIKKEWVITFGIMILVYVVYFISLYMITKKRNSNDEWT